MRAILLLALLASSASAAAPQPDIIMQARFDRVSSPYQVDRIRTVFVNSGIGDPFDLKLENTYYVSIPVETASMAKKIGAELDTFARLIGMDLMESRFVFGVKGIHYKIAKVSADLQPVNAPNGFQVFGKLQLNDVQVETDELTVSLVLTPQGMSVPTICFEPTTQTNVEQQKLAHCELWKDQLVTLFTVKLNSPAVRTDPALSLPFSARVAVRTADRFRFELIDSSFAAFKQTLQKFPEKVELSKLAFENIPDVSFRIGSRKITITGTQIDSIVQGQRPAIQDALIAQFANAAEQSLGELLLNLIFQQNVPSGLWVDSSIYSGFKAAKITAEPDDQVAIEVAGSFCSPKEYKELGEGCVSIQPVLEPVREIPDSEYAESRKMIVEELQKNEANFVFSIGEHYVNRLLDKTVEMGFWNDSLKAGDPEGRLVMGPKKVFMVLDKKGAEGTLWIDLVYKLPKLYRIAMGTKYVRFPLAFNVEIYFKHKIVDKEDIPIFTVKITGADTSRKTIIDGQHGIESKMGKLFKKRVVRTIRDSTKGLIGQEVLSFDVPVLKNLGLEKAKFFADGHGRAIGKLKVAPESSPSYLRGARVER